MSAPAIRKRLLDCLRAAIEAEQDHRPTDRARHMADAMVAAADLDNWDLADEARAMCSDEAAAAYDAALEAERDARAADAHYLNTGEL